MTTIVTVATTLVASIGGWEAIRWFLTRKSNQRIADATAEKAELQNEKDEFHFLRERLEFKDKQLMDKEQRFAEQTEMVRELNKQLLEQVLDNGKLMARISGLEAERAMKLCEVRGCQSRQPQSGY